MEVLAGSVPVLDAGAVVHRIDEMVFAAAAKPVNASEK